MSVVIFDHDTNWKTTYVVAPGVTLEEVMRVERFMLPIRKQQVMEMLERALDEDVEQ